MLMPSTVLQILYQMEIQYPKTGKYNTTNSVITNTNEWYIIGLSMFYNAIIITFEKGSCYNTRTSSTATGCSIHIVFRSVDQIR